MAKWLFKSEPDVFSWDDLVSRGKDGEEWDGVRNYQARNNMREMKEGELGFFYHSRSGLEIVGIVEICNEAHPDSTTEDERWECVDVRAVKPLPRAITMKEIKAEPRLKDMVLANNSRLSVQPVSEAEWDVILEISGA
ncbi:EVE domain-containing protein [Pseudoroseicyclus tamaricis]|uniref:EVE domain-containing protein n=1 Tax=Pseudoroseicyclus tamaricis TaxID=2705421 RepID=A0A6B2JWY3_9RHOB|nr:EVE domain-containing protein [Pseudoroseicyclus tamaricis]NDV02640.1 EVE domain-containing protein [Pseudoroseicyclus tamaricis]